MASKYVNYGNKWYEVENADNLSHEEIISRAEAAHYKPVKASGVKGFGSAALNGLTLNNGKRAWGGLTAALKHWGDYAMPDKEIKERYGDKDKMNEAIVQDYHKGVQDFTDVNEPYKKDHKVLNTLGEIAGGVPLAMIPLGHAAKGATVGAKMLQGAKTGAVLGGAYGAGSGIDKSENVLSKEAAVNALKGGGIGALAGAGTGAAAAGASHMLGRGVKALKNVGVKGAQRSSLENIGNENVERAIDSKTPLINQENPQMSDEIQRTVVNSQEAKKIFNKELSDRLADQRANIQDELTKTTGNLNAQEQAAKIATDSREKVGKLYKAIEEKGVVDTSIPKDIADISKNIAEDTAKLKMFETIAKDPNYVGSAKLESSPINPAKLEALRQKIADNKALVSDGEGNIFQEKYIKDLTSKVKELPQYRDLADNHAKVLMAVDKRLADKKYELGGNRFLDSKGIDEKYKVNYFADRYRREMDRLMPEYKQARQAHIDINAEPLDALKAGQKLGNLSTKEFSELKQALVEKPNTRESFKAGFGDTAREKLHAAANDEASQYGKIYTDNVIRRLKILTEAAPDLNILPSEEFLGQKNAVESIAKALGNSKTIHGLAQQKGMKKFNVRWAINKLLGVAGEESSEEASRNLAEAFLNPEKLKILYNTSKMSKPQRQAYKIVESVFDQVGKQGGQVGEKLVRERT